MKCAVNVLLLPFSAAQGTAPTCRQTSGCLLLSGAHSQSCAHMCEPPRQLHHRLNRQAALCEHRNQGAAGGARQHGWRPCEAQLVVQHVHDSNEVGVPAQPRTAAAAAAAAGQVTGRHTPGESSTRRCESGRAGTAHTLCSVTVLAECAAWSLERLPAHRQLCWQPAHHGDAQAAAPHGPQGICQLPRAAHLKPPPEKATPSLPCRCACTAGCKQALSAAAARLPSCHRLLKPVTPSRCSRAAAAEPVVGAVVVLAWLLLLAVSSLQSLTLSVLLLHDGHRQPQAQLLLARGSALLAVASC